MAKVRTLTRLQLAKALDCNPRTIPKWQEEGMPVAERGRGGRASRYDEVAVRAWVEGHEKAVGQTDVARERARKEKAQAELAEQLHQARARNLLPADEVEKVVAARVAAARTLVLSWKSALVPTLARAFTLGGEAEMERVFDEAARRFLFELSGVKDTVSSQKRRKGEAA